jgi:predicted CoA-binding protein/RimJ/RimL family protein N-acetyltransferase
MRPTDGDAVIRFHNRQSDESIYFRFFAPMPRLSDKDLHRFTHLDYKDRVAIVCTMGEEIVGIGRFDRVEPTEAEVAFNISDAHQGRGVGSVLLEHLAAAARELGVTRFVADVLPHNRKMLGVFRDAGYEVRHTLEDGVISLSFTIRLTEKSLAVMEAREHRSEAQSLRVLFNPKSVVVAGASRREGSIGHRLIQAMREGGYTGRLMAVHPEADVVHGVPAVKRLAEIDGTIELLVVAVPAAGVLDLVQEAAERGLEVWWSVPVVSLRTAPKGPNASGTWCTWPGPTECGSSDRTPGD